MRLFDKYRPKNLSGMVGQPCLWALRKLAADPFSCCLMFEGPPGTGKTAAALALAAELGCEEEWSGLTVVPSVDLTIERCRELFERTLRLIPMMGSGWRVLVIEELEACSSAAVQRYLKVALDTGLPPKAMVIATSNNTKPLDEALVQRFDQFLFQSDASFMHAAGDRLREIWRLETQKPCPVTVTEWGWDATGKWWSFREALKKMQMHLRL